MEASDKSVWEMWRGWDEAEWGLHVQGPQGSSRIRVGKDPAILLGRCKDCDGRPDREVDEAHAGSRELLRRR